MRVAFKHLDRALRKARFKCKEPLCPERYQIRCRFSDHIDLEVEHPDVARVERKHEKIDRKKAVIAKFKGLPFRL